MANQPATDGVSFEHRALLYAGESDFLASTVPFILDGTERDEAILVMVEPRKIDLLRGAVPQSAQVTFSDMTEVGRNPARILPAWRSFIAENHADRGLRGIGEPAWPGRTAAELVECFRHEALLNLAFRDGPAWLLLCPYDVDALDDGAVAEARHSHPVISHGDGLESSGAYGGLALASAYFDDPLSEPPTSAASLVFGAGDLDAVRGVVAAHAGAAGLARSRIDDVVLVTNEVATNSVLFGGGGGELLVWREPTSLVCEVRDGGFITDPLAGRESPGPDQLGGRGLWLANQLCDLVQVRSTPAGTVVRLRLELPSRG